MSARIDPRLYCATPDCRRPRETGRSYCTPCIRLARAVGRQLDDEPSFSPDLTLTDPAGDSNVKPPRCIAYLSQAGDVITLELTDEPKFTEADIERVVWALTRREPESDYEADRLADFAEDARQSDAAELGDES